MGNNDSNLFYFVEESVVFTEEILWLSLSLHLTILLSRTVPKNKSSPCF